jgi:hypothetical protein
MRDPVMNRFKSLTICSMLFGVACGGKPTASAPTASPAASSSTATIVATGAPVPSASASVAPATAERPKPKPVLQIKEGISTPESVLYDDIEDRYLVSNINGDPLAADNNGFITEISPDGKITRPKFIAGGLNKVKLDAPKGTGIFKGTLYVSDITVVRKFDAKTGAPKGDIPISGATFLNDIAVSADGKIYVSDSGLKHGANGLESNGGDAVFVIEANKPHAISRSKDLAGPNGLAVVGQQLVVVTFGSEQVYTLSDKGVKSEVTKLPAGGLDGVVALGDELLISSWQASSVFRGKLGGKFEVVIPEVKAPADIGYDTKRKRVLVPHFTENSVEVFDLP